MSEKNKENSVVFSNKELKEAANTPPVKQMPPKKRASFIDDAGSILSDIKSAIGDEVAEELQRFEDEDALQQKLFSSESRLCRKLVERRSRHAERPKKHADKRRQRNEVLMNRPKDGPEPESTTNAEASKATVPEPAAFTQEAPAKAKCRWSSVLPPCW